VLTALRQPSLAQRVKAAAPEPIGEGGPCPRATARQATNRLQAGLVQVLRRKWRYL